MPKKENLQTVSVEFPAEMYEALAFCLDEKGSSIKSEIEQFLLKLYSKNVPAAIKNYLSAKQKFSAEGGSKKRPPQEDAV